MFKSEAFNKVACAINKFSVSVWYSILLFAGASLFIFIKQDVLGVYILAIIISFTMVFSDDLVPVIEGIIVTACFAIRCKYSMDEFVSFWYLSLPVFIFVILHVIRFGIRFKKTTFIPGMIATSIAIILGGAGVIYWKTYFSPTSLFYMASLGFGMVLLCLYVTNSLSKERSYDFGLKFAYIHINVIAVLAVSLLFEYISRRNELHGKFGVIPFQWRNNAATLIMLAMPFAFYLAKRHFAWIFAGLIAYIEIVLTGSRGGLIFGTAEFALCLILMLIFDKNNRIKYTVTIILGAVFAVSVSKLFLETISGTVSRMLDPDENSIRLKLIERGIRDFKDNPVFGQGLAYMGNRDIHHSAKHTLCWYHCSLIQVPASMGIVGIIAYIYLNVLRVRTFIRNRSFLSLILFISFIGIEMMSLVNPGIFVPFPYLLYITIYFIVMETQNPDNKVLKQ